jgi:succinate dehydrogenase/fumarate reductase flavoprotein subunit
MKKITRREALKRGGQITAGAAAASALSPIIGCAKGEEYTPDGKFIRSKSITDREVIETDLLIIGSGFAGMWAAISAKDHGVKDIAMVDKGAIGDSSKSKTCAGATIYCESGDDIDVWLEEFTRVQRYLSRQDIVSHLFETSESRLKRMQSWGLWYKSSLLVPERLPSRGFRHIKMRALPRWKGRGGGAALMALLQEQVVKRGVRFYSKIMITDLLKGNGRIAGAVGIHRITGKPVGFKARAIVLAASDCSFRGNYACVEAVTGDAFRLAYDVGVRLSNMEFLVSNTGSPRYGFEGTGVALKFGGKILNGNKNTFMENYHPDGTGAEINYLVQAMTDEVTKGNAPPFYLDMTSLRSKFYIKFIWDRFTSGYMKKFMRALREHGMDITDSLQEWLPVIQTLRGGVRTNSDGMSDLPGLFAAGMSQSVDPGLFNGWSTMRAMGTGERAGKAAAEFLRGSDDVRLSIDMLRLRKHASISPLKRSSGLHPDEVCRRLQGIIFPYTVSIRKSEKSLGMALEEVERIRDNDIPALNAEDPHQLVKVHETRNMVQIAEIFLRASLERKETRADHYREDYPETDNKNWLKWINVARDRNGRVSLSTEKVPLNSYRFRPGEETS